MSQLARSIATGYEPKRIKYAFYSRSTAPMVWIYLQTLLFFCLVTQAVSWDPPELVNLSPAELTSEQLQHLAVSTDGLTVTSLSEAESSDSFKVILAESYHRPTQQQQNVNRFLLDSLSEILGHFGHSANGIGFLVPVNPTYNSFTNQTLKQSTTLCKKNLSPLLQTKWLLTSHPTTKEFINNNKQQQNLSLIHI